jgi:hypothetical protein
MLLVECRLFMSIGVPRQGVMYISPACWRVYDRAERGKS